jgi:small multidrug resistance pump
MDSDKIASVVLRLAGLYNVAWGALVVLFPALFFDWAGLPRPNYLEIWQCVGMIVGVYGLGYWWAASAPSVHWPIVAVGLLGKIFGPIGFVRAYLDGVFNLKFATIIVFNDLIWLVPFLWVLYQAYWRNVGPRSQGAY